VVGNAIRRLYIIMCMRPRQNDNMKKKIKSQNRLLKCFIPDAVFKEIMKQLSSTKNTFYASTTSVLSPFLLCKVSDFFDMA
jgi:hypothetical protein